MTKKKLELPLLIICGLAFILDLVDVWWSVYVLIISFCTLSFFYAFLSILPDNDKINIQNLKKIFSGSYRMKSFINFLGGICLAFLITGILAKLQIWGWANNALKQYVIFGSVILIAALVKKNLWLTTRLVFFLVVASILYFIPKETILKLKPNDYKEYLKEINEPHESI